MQEHTYLAAVSKKRCKILQRLSKLK